MYIVDKQEVCQICMEMLMADHSTREIELITNNILESRLFKIYNSDISHNKDSLNRLINSIVLKIRSGEPIQYVLNEACFLELILEVNADVLIPRPETEELVFELLKLLDKNVSYRILDVGTGSGCIAIILKKRFPKIQMYALDHSEGALRIAQKNANTYLVDIQFILHDFIKSNPDIDDLDFIISNPPYISIDEKRFMSESVLNFEPLSALFPEGDDPDIFYRHIANFAINALKFHGKVFCEINEFRVDSIVRIFNSTGFQDLDILNDMQGKSRILIATKV
jgi:release factor glutamine methyltransferase